MTLVELVVAISLTSVIFAGAGTALFFVNKASRQETKNNVTLLDAKNLSQVIDLTIKDNKAHTIDYLPDDPDDPDDTENIGKTSYGKLFTVDGVEYGFDKTTFGVSEDGKIEGENVKYKSDYDMYFSVKKHLDNKFIEFVIHYGDNYASSLSLVERI